MSARGSSTRLIGSSRSSYGGQAAARPSADWSPSGTRSGWMPKSSSAAAVCSPTAATLTPANARASRPYSSNRSRTARTAFDRGEGDPLVPAGDQALDRALHLLRRARRLDRDRRHLLRHRAVVAQPLRHRRRPAPWSAGTRTRQPNSGLVSNQDSWSWAATASPTTAMAEPLVLARDTPAALRSAADPAQAGDHGLLRARRAVPGDGQPGALRPARRDQHLAEVGRCRVGAEHDQRGRAVRDLARLGGVDDAQLAVPLAGQRDARVGRDRGGGRTRRARSRT